MARRKKGNPINGWIVLDKRQGMTSTQAVGAVRRLFSAQKAGHAGTLDPLATGILPIALGEATKTVSFAVEGAKAYRFTVRWGAQTNTDDSEGEVTRTSERRPTVEDIDDLLPRFTGLIQQTPPQFSAIKVDGNRAYDLAREGETVELASREIEIDALRLVDMPDADTSVFEAECGKGTYVRALARDFGIELGCFGHVIELRRTLVGAFDESVSVTLAELDAMAAGAGRRRGARGPVAAGGDGAARSGRHQHQSVRCRPHRAWPVDPDPRSRRPGDVGRRLRHVARPTARHRRAGAGRVSPDAGVQPRRDGMTIAGRGATRPATPPRVAASRPR